MDNSRSWSPPVSLIWLAVLLAVLTGLVTLLSSLGTALGGTIQPPGRLLLGVATVLLAALAAHGALVRPRLAADRHGVTVRGLSGARSWPWATLRYHLRHTSRFGRKVVTLELDGMDGSGAEHLAVLGRLDLGEDPVDVAATLDELRDQRHW